MKYERTFGDGFSRDDRKVTEVGHCLSPVSRGMSVEYAYGDSCAGKMKENNSEVGIGNAFFDWNFSCAVSGGELLLLLICPQRDFWRLHSFEYSLPLRKQGE